MSTRTNNGTAIATMQAAMPDLNQPFTLLCDDHGVLVKYSEGNVAFEVRGMVKGSPVIHTIVEITMEEHKKGHVERPLGMHANPLKCREWGFAFTYLIHVAGIIHDEDFEEEYPMNIDLLERTRALEGDVLVENIEPVQASA